MEVTRDKLPSLAVLGLIALRSDSDVASRPLFAECLRYPSEGAEPASSEAVTSSPSPPASEHSRSTAQSSDVAASEEQSARSPDEEQDSDDPPAESLTTAVTTPAVTVPPDEAEIEATAEPGEGVSAVAEAEEGVDAPQVAVSPTEPTSPADEESVVAVATTGPDLSVELPETKEPQPDVAKVLTEKAKRAKGRPQADAAESIESSGEPHTEKSSDPVTKPAAPHQQPEATAEPGPPEVTPLDLSREDKGAHVKGAKEPLGVTADNKQPPPVPEPNGPTSSPTAEPSSAPQADASLATGVTAATSKPPAAFLKSKATHADSARPAGDIDPARFLSRVVKAFESAHQRSSEVRLRLHPAELGALSIEIKVQDSVLTASVQAETPDAKAAIVDNLPALRERLADQGIRIDQFDVDLMDHSDRRQQSLEEQARRQEDRQPSAQRSASRRAVTSEPQGARPAQHRTNGPNGLNVVI